MLKAELIKLLNETTAESDNERDRVNDLEDKYHKDQVVAAILEAYNEGTIDKAGVQRLNNWLDTEDLGRIYNHPDHYTDLTMTMVAQRGEDGPLCDIEFTLEPIQLMWSKEADPYKVALDVQPVQSNLYDDLLHFEMTVEEAKTLLDLLQRAIDGSQRQREANATYLDGASPTA